ncbi:hypothetical protein [Thermomonospora cellulosilytica]|uniref:Uncharacterized protein n=1 Tax=Thermomonospora cellulosilytica TaxID=1411118 RepID=A0A7W3RC31_9ACTN|nr:hypothetical protein [Thermomonospora cellulosilytica]MBA9008008.1 hypothetical protein [Thermomonospora cellulosilytica]
MTGVHSAIRTVPEDLGSIALTVIVYGLAWLVAGLLSGYGLGVAHRERRGGFRSRWF